MRQGIKSLMVGKNQMPRRFELEVGCEHLHPHCNLIPLLQLNDDFDQAGWCPLSSFHSHSFYILSAPLSKLKHFSPSPAAPSLLFLFCFTAFMLFFFISSILFQGMGLKCSHSICWFALEQGLKWDKGFWKSWTIHNIFVLSHWH